MERIIVVLGPGAETTLRASGAWGTLTEKAQIAFSVDDRGQPAVVASALQSADGKVFYPAGEHLLLCECTAGEKLSAGWAFETWCLECDQGGMGDIPCPYCTWSTEEVAMSDLLQKVGR